MKGIGAAVAAAALVLVAAVPVGAQSNDPSAAVPEPFPSWETFLQRQYRDVLDRGPDDASHRRELGRLRRGESTPVGVIERFLETPPTGPAFLAVVRLWVAALGRPPVLDELVHWSRQVRGGSLAEAGAAVVAGSDLAALTDDAFVERLYDVALGRAPDAGGRRHWLDALAAGPLHRGDVVVALSESTEFRRRSDSVVLATVVHTLLLRRAPTETDLATSGPQVADGPGPLIDSLLRSEEYQDRIGRLCAPGSLRYCRRVATAGEPDVLSGVVPYQLVLPSPVPPGWVVDRAYVSATPLGYRPPLTTLYGDPELADPLTGPTLAVGEAFEGSGVPGTWTEGFRSEVIDGRTVGVGTDRQWAWVTWSDSSCECVVFVSGRNLGEAAVLQAARHVSDVFTRPVIADAGLPDGLVALVSAPVDPELAFLTDTERLAYRSSGTARVAIGVTIADARYLWLVRFWVAEVSGGDAATVARGVAAGVGSALETVDVSYRAGNVVVVTGQDVPVDTLGAFAASLRPAPPGSWATVRDQARDLADLPQLCFTPGGSPTVIEGLDGPIRWGVVFADQSCEILLVPGRAFDTIGGGSPPDAGPGELAMFPSSFSGGRAQGTLVSGNAPPGTAAVWVVLSDGRSMFATLADAGARPGERYYAAFFRGDLVGPFTTTAFALDAAGHVIRARSN